MVLTFAVLLTPGAVRGQLPDSTASVAPPVVDFAFGITRSRQSWTPPVTVADRTGISIAGAVEVQLPAGGLGLRVGLGWVQRGGRVLADSQGRAVGGEVLTEYLTFPVHVVLGKWVGPVRLYVAAGPTLETLLRVREDIVVGRLLDVEHNTVFAAAVSAGVTGRIGNGLRLAVEVRRTEGVGDALAGPFTRVRGRSTEFEVRVGLPLDRVIRRPGAG